MDFSGYSEEIQTLANQILEERCNNQDGVKKYCTKMIQLGRETQDDYLLGFAHYYLAEGYFVSNDYTKFVDALTVSIEHQQKASQWTLLTRAYNMLGVTAHTRGNLAVALDHYLAALQYCQEYGFVYEQALVYANLGHLHRAEKNYQEALEYFARGREYFEKETENRFAYSNIILIDIAVGGCCLELGDMEGALKRDELIRENEGQLVPGDYSMIPILCFRFRLAYEQGRGKECEDYMNQLEERLSVCPSLLDIHDEILGYGEFLLKIGKYPEFVRIEKSIEPIIADMEIPNLIIRNLRLWIRYYDLQQNREQYLENCAKLYQMEEQNQEDEINMYRSSTKIRFMLEESKHKEDQLLKEKLALIEKSETDALTGLANRYRLNDHAERMFEKAYREQKSLGVVMVDIDYFKQYNDTYGHQAGDVAIRTLADCLAQVCQQEEAFCARYGGDEFVVVYYDKTDEEILESAKGVSQNLLEKRLLHKKSPVSDYVTISQGIRNTIPSAGNKLWDYMFSADTALYKMKNHGRNGIYLVHKMEAEGVDTVLVKDE